MGGRAAAILDRLEHFGVKLGLERVRLLLTELGSPQRAVPTVLVAGTNGKGSTASLLAAIGSAAGYRTGLFTSPHLEDVRERIVVDDQAIGEDELAGALERVIEAAGRHGGDPPTYFESLTASACLHFRDLHCDLAIFEVGLGGRLDATNATHPRLAVITSIGLDHTSLLGDTLTAIAGEKLGIVRPGSALVAWLDPPEVAAAIEAHCSRLGTRVHDARHEVDVDADEQGSTVPQKATLTTPRGSYRASLALAGRHQLRNAALALRAAELLADDGFDRIDVDAVARGISACRWPGRLEWIDLGDGRRVLLDGAHNGDGAAVLCAYLETLATPPDLLFGALGDKRPGDILPPIAARCRLLTLTRPPDSRRARDPREWLRLIPEAQPLVEDDAERALDLALERCADVLLVCGSLYLVGAVRGALRRRFGVPPPAFGVDRRKAYDG